MPLRHAATNAFSAPGTIWRAFAERIAVEDIAAAAGLSASRLSHLFRSETGQTHQRHLEAIRMQRAADLLRTSFSVKQIAAAVGFESPFYFSLRFKDSVHKSSAEFRRTGNNEFAATTPARATELETKPRRR